MRKLHIKKGINQCSDKEMSNVYFLTHFMRFVYARLPDKAKFDGEWMRLSFKDYIVADM